MYLSDCSWRSFAEAFASKNRSAMSSRSPFKSQHTKSQDGEENTNKAANNLRQRPAMSDESGRDCLPAYLRNVIATICTSHNASWCQQLHCMSAYKEKINKIDVCSESGGAKMVWKSMWRSHSKAFEQISCGEQHPPKFILWPAPWGPLDELHGKCVYTYCWLISKNSIPRKGDRKRVPKWRSFPNLS